MAGRRLVLFLACVLCVFSISCTKIDNGRAMSGELKMETAGLADSIPLEYGDLVGVTQAAKFSGAILWFEKPDRSIQAVWVDTVRGSVVESLAIPRR